jgi:cytosine/adenosine deaminase-related metal-dependent hydrolase
MSGNGDALLQRMGLLQEQLFDKRSRFESPLAAHGVTCSLATNNVLNPFTPFGDCSLIEIANLYANVARLGDVPSLCSCLDMVTHGPAKLINVRSYGVQVGNPADPVVLDCSDEPAAIAEIVQPLFALKRGRRSFTRAADLAPAARLRPAQTHALRVTVSRLQEPPEPPHVFQISLRSGRLRCDLMSVWRCLY